ncbi:hypothetical protein [Thalassomonas actiniarum]|uniref:Lipoprotein n=1 Tax=Thalassomonas actiniarum TaxID=485447 RepID=A0AAF0C187_9GAMM|nr:hypothetical protein [Thalassomonas actiniarum]WDD97192.1 hypothetical protein SG35_017810 [Thalassomonas actiniarum]
MSIRTIILLPALTLLFSCATNEEALPYIENKQLVEAYKHLASSLSQTRKPLLYQGGHQATNCRDYIKLATKHNLDETLYNQTVKSEYLVCDALDILSRSGGVSPVPTDVSTVGEQLLTQLDLRSFPSSLYRASSEHSHTLKSLYPGKTSASGTIASFNSKDWSFTLEVVAITRVNNNEFPDWIVWVLDEAKTGNYRGYSTLIIYDPNTQQSMKGSLYPKIL